MKILNWNIYCGGGKRVQGIVKELSTHASDVVVLTEYRKGKVGDELLGELVNIGYSYITSADSKRNQNTALLATKYEHHLSELDLPESLVPYAFAVSINDLIVVPAFCATPDVGIEYLAYLSNLGKQQNLKAIAVGDFYHGIRGSDRKAENVISSKLSENWINLFQGQATELEVWSHRNANGGVSRPDHAWVTKNLHNRFTEAVFFEKPLDDKISDHAPMVFEYFISD